MPYFIATTDIDNNMNGYGTSQRGDTIYVQEQLVFDTAAQAGHPKLCVMPKELEQAIWEKSKEYDEKWRALEKHKAAEIKALCLTFLQEVGK